MAVASGLSCEVEQRAGCAVVRPSGALDAQTYAALRDVLLECAVEQPRAVVVELDGLVIRSQSLLSVFTTVWIRTRDWPDVPLLLVAGAPHRELLRGAALRRFVRVHPTLAEALDGVDLPPPRERAHRVFLSDPSSPRLAREFTRRVARGWDLPEPCVERAVQVASELVENTVLHTASEARLRLELSRGRLTVAVGDDDVVPAVLRDPGAAPGCGGKGLLVVAQVAKTWGCLPDRVNGRKVVWAVLTIGETRPARPLSPP